MQTELDSRRGTNEGKNTMEQNLDKNTMAPEMSAEELAKLQATMEGLAVSTDVEEPADEDRVLN